MADPYTPSTTWVRIMVGYAKAWALDRVLPVDVAREEGYEWFDRWLAKHDAALTAQLLAAQAAIARVVAAASSTSGERLSDTICALFDADTSDLAEHDKQVAAKVLRKAADDLDRMAPVGWDHELVMKGWPGSRLRARAASIEQTETDRG